MLKTNLLIALFSLFSFYTELHAQALGLKIQPGFSKLITSPGISQNGLNRTFCTGLFMEDRFSYHHAVGLELSALQIKSNISSFATSTIFSPTGTSTTLTYAATIKNNIQFMVLNGYYRYFLRGRWGFKSGMQCMIPLMETTQISYDGNISFQDNTNTDVGMPYFKLGLTGGLEFAIDKRFRLGLDYYRETSHIERQRPLSPSRVQIFSLGLKFSFIKSRYEFS